MAISFRRYVDITSGVGGEAGVRQRDLIGRLFTVNSLLPPGSFIEFDSADDVATYFGSSSEEYLRAAFYFSWISKNITRAKKIAFARWVSQAVAPVVYGATGAQAVSTYTGINAGSLSVTLGAETHTLTGLNFGAATSLSDVAGVVQAAIRVAGTGALWDTATVAWDATAKRFILTGGEVGEAAIVIAAGSTGTDVASLLGWLSDAILCEGADAESITDTLSASADASNNFGSFLFLPTLTLEEVEEAAIWNATQNVTYQLMVPTAAADASAWSAALLGYAGVALTLAGPTGEYHEMVPMIVLAATNYSARNSVQNYMFQQFSTLTPTVTTTTKANIYDPLRVNFYGRTQTAGQYLDFYQRGTLCGGSTAPVDMNTFANEQWLKDAVGAAIMSLLLSLARISANTQGRAQLLATVQSVVQDALYNGAISVGKTLTSTQKLYITEQTDDDKAWLQVQGIGYWLDCSMESTTTTDGRTEWKAVYTLIYAKDDAIRAVDGTHILI